MAGGCGGCVNVAVAVCVACAWVGRVTFQLRGSKPLCSFVAASVKLNVSHDCLIVDPAARLMNAVTFATLSRRAAFCGWPAAMPSYAVPTNLQLSVH